MCVSEFERSDSHDERMVGTCEYTENENRFLHIYVGDIVWKKYDCISCRIEELIKRVKWLYTFLSGEVWTTFGIEQDDLMLSYGRIIIVHRCYLHYLIFSYCVLHSYIRSRNTFIFTRQNGSNLRTKKIICYCSFFLSFSVLPSWQINWVKYQPNHY